RGAHEAREPQRSPRGRRAVQALRGDDRGGDGGDPERVGTHRARRLALREGLAREGDVVRRTIGAICALAVAGTALAQRDRSKVEIKTTKVAGAVSMLEGAGGNIGVSAGADGLLVVDDQFAPLSDKIKAAIEKI